VTLRGWKLKEDGLGKDIPFTAEIGIIPQDDGTTTTSLAVTEYTDRVSKTQPPLQQPSVADVKQSGVTAWRALRRLEQANGRGVTFTEWLTALKLAGSISESSLKTAIKELNKSGWLAYDDDTKRYNTATPATNGGRN
jgi:hypothetical protein